MRYFPVFLDSIRVRALVVGGGTVAAAKVETLKAHGAQVKVVAREVRQGVRQLAERHGKELHLAVRSSALDEDRKTSSFAGLYHSALNVSRDELIDTSLRSGLNEIRSELGEVRVH